MPRERNARKGDGSGLFIPAGVLLGLGIGLAYGRADVGVLVGLGIGFLIFALIKIVKRW